MIVAKDLWKNCKTSLKTIIHEQMTKIGEDCRNASPPRQWKLSYFLGATPNARADQRRLVGLVAQLSKNMRRSDVNWGRNDHRGSEKVTFFAFETSVNDEYGTFVTTTPSWTRILRAYVIWYFDQTSSDTNTPPSSRGGKQDQVPEVEQLHGAYLPVGPTRWLVNSSTAPENTNDEIAGYFPYPAIDQALENMMDM